MATTEVIEASEECIFSTNGKNLKHAEAEWEHLVSILGETLKDPLPSSKKFTATPSKLRWAPVNISLERRIQTASVCYFLFLFIVSPAVSVIGPIYLLFYTSYWWLVAIYAIWMFYDWNSHLCGSYSTEWLRRQKVWVYFAQYFPITLKKTVDLSPHQNYIFGAHPHGILGISSFANFATEGTGWSNIFPGIKPHLVTLPTQFRFPLRRELVLMTGAISSSADSISHVLTQPEKGEAVAIILGGAEEALDSHPDNFDLKLSSRKGFVKLALKTGAHLVPVYNFGETSTFRQMQNSRGTKLRGFQSKFKEVCGFSPPLFFGRGIFNYSFGLLPYRTPITTVVGSPIFVKQNLNPTQENIDQLHAEYCAQLARLFDENKADYGIPSDVKIKIY